MMKSLTCALLVTTATLMPQRGLVNQEKVLRRRVESFYSMFSSGRNNGMWKMLSVRLRKGNDNDRKKYLSQLPKPGTNHIVVSIGRIRVDGSRATVELSMAVVSNKGDEIGRGDKVDSWVFEHGRWCYDGPGIDVRELKPGSGLRYCDSFSSENWSLVPESIHGESVSKPHDVHGAGHATPEGTV